VGGLSAASKQAKAKHSFVASPAEISFTSVEECYDGRVWQVQIEQEREEEQCFGALPKGGVFVTLGQQKKRMVIDQTHPKKETGGHYLPCCELTRRRKEESTLLGFRKHPTIGGVQFKNDSHHWTQREKKNKKGSLRKKGGGGEGSSTFKRSEKLAFQTEDKRRDTEKKTIFWGDNAWWFQGGLGRGRGEGSGLLKHWGHSKEAELSCLMEKELYNPTTWVPGDSKVSTTGRRNGGVPGET